MKPAPSLLLLAWILAATTSPAAGPPAGDEPVGDVALVRRAPRLDGGRIEGSLWLLGGEDVALNGRDAVRGTLFVPGTPTVEVAGRAVLGGRAEGPGGPEPAGYRLRLAGNASLDRLVTRTDPQGLEPVAAPPAPAGTRDVKLERPGEDAGDFATVRDLTVEGRAGAVAVPPGTYRRLAASGRNALVLGVAGAAEPAAYDLRELQLAGGAELRLAGPVALTVARRMVLDGSAHAGDEADPRRLRVRVAGERVAVKGNAALFAVVQAPAGAVTLAGKGRLRGSVACDRLRIRGGGVLEVVVDDLARPRNQAPAADAGPDQTLALPATARLAGTASDDGYPRGSSLALAWSQASGPGTVSFADPASPTTEATFSAPGTYVLRLTAGDSELSASDEVTLTVDPENQAPTVDAGPDRSLFLPAAAALAGAAQDDGWPRGSSLAATWTQVSGPGTVAFADPSAPATSASFSAAGAYVLRLAATDSHLSASDEVAVRVEPPLPPDPATVAPAPAAGVATSVATATAFLYTGPEAVQTGVAPGAIEPARAAVLRGRSLDRAGEPLPGVAVRLAGHPELGSTRSRLDGRFDLAVNGGGPVTVVYEKEGFLPLERPATAPWQDYAQLPDVRLTPVDPRATAVALGAAAPPQVAQGSPVADEDGERRPTVLFPAGVAATLVLPDGSTRPLAAATVRATEYTVGPGGPAAMPAPLPPNSAYTYAVELSVDEALAAGAQDVRFDRPVWHYVENFLDFPVGSPVPVGYYDRGKAAWVPSENGRIVAIAGLAGPAGDIAEVDADGDGAADGPEALAALGITEAERRQLAALYRPGQTLWRVPITHFSAWDCNWGFWPPPDARNPNLPPPKGWSPPSPPCTAGPSSIVECESQVLGESLPVAGTPFQLTYRSDRVAGHTAGRRLEIPVSGPSVPGSLAGIELTVDVAGQSHRQNLEPRPGQTRTFVWDGKDAYGREAQGSPRASVTVSYAYRAHYAPVPRFGYNGAGAPIQGDRARQQTFFSETHTASVHRWDARGQGLGGWTLDVHHAYDPVGKVLYLGDGRRVSAESVQLVIQSAAGGGRNLGDGGPATQAQLGSPRDVAVGPDGSVYVGEQDRVRKVSPDGVITTYVGRGGGCFPWNAPCGDGGPATQAQLNAASGLAVGPDGSLYFFANARLRRVGPDGIITTIAGTGAEGFSGDGGPAAMARVSGGGIAVAPDGTLYFADSGSNRVRRIGTDGIITTVAGNGSAGSDGDGGPATAAQIRGPADVALGPDGSLYIADTQGGHRQRVRKVSPAGIITTVAGPGCCQNSASHLPWHGDGGPATGARLDGLGSLDFGPDGALYLMQGGYRPFLRRIGPDGVITTVAGLLIEAPHTQGLAGDGGSATLARFSGANSMAVGPDGTLWVSDGAFWDGSRSVNNNRLRRISPYLPGFAATDLLIPSEDGALLHVFDAEGRHLRTLSTLTGAVRHRFDYDAAGRLAAVVDGDGNATRVERDAEGRPVAIVAPFGQRTALEVDAGGYLARVANPMGEAMSFSYAPGGLLAAAADPLGHASRYEYDAEGRLAAAVDRAGRRRTWTRTDPSATSWEVTFTDPLGAVARYAVERPAAGGLVRTNTFPGGERSRLTLDTASTRSLALPDGSSVALAGDPDPRFGMQAPLPRSTTATPGGRAMTVAAGRSATLATPGNPLTLTALTDTTSVNGRVSTRSYIPASRTFTTVTPAGRKSVQVVDAQGRTVRSQAAALHPVTLSYDAHGRLASLAQGTGAEARTVAFGYDAAGNLAEITDPIGRTARFEHDAAGRLLRQILPDGRAIAYTWDAGGNLAAVAAPGGAVHRFAYSPLGAETEHGPPGAEAAATRSSYDEAGRLRRIERPDGQVLELAYDPGGRLAGITVPAGPIAYSRDPAGRVSTVTSPGGVTLTQTWDGPLPTGWAWSGPVAGAVRGSYDNDFRVVSRTVEGSGAIAYQYDADGLPTRAGDLALQRSAESGLLVGSTLGGLGDSWTYDGFGEPVRYAATAAGAPLYSYQLTRDRLGRITAKEETLEGSTVRSEYGYDARGRLVEVKKDGAVAAAWSYDDNGNRVRSTGPAGEVVAEHDERDRLLRRSGATYTYTAAGELASRTDGAGTTTYEIDALGNLRAVALADGRRVEYLVDGANRRIGKKADGALVQAFLWEDALRPAAELDGAGRLVSRFVYASRPNVPDSLIRDGATYRILADHLGSPRLVVDAATGRVAQRLDYDELGRVVRDTSPGFQPFGFAGGLYDRDTGLVRFGARDYDPETGRWTAPDPLRFAGGDPNLYGYALGDPINLTDPRGLEWQIAVGVNAMLGGSPFLLLGPFVGGGVSLGVTSGGLVFVQFQAANVYGPGLTFGVGVDVTVTHSACPLQPGLTTSWGPYAQAQLGPWSLGAGNGSIGGTFSAGPGQGLMAGAGVATATTYGTSILPLAPVLGEIALIPFAPWRAVWP